MADIFSCHAIIFRLIFFPPLCKSPQWARASLYRGLTITLRHTTLGWASLGEWSVRRRDLYLTTHNTHKRHSCTLPAGFEPATPASKRPQTHALHCAGTAFGTVWCYVLLPPLQHCPLSTVHSVSQWTKSQHVFYSMVFNVHFLISAYGFYTSLLHNSVVLLHVIW